MSGTDVLFQSGFRLHARLEEHVSAAHLTLSSTLAQCRCFSPTAQTNHSQASDFQKSGAFSFLPNQSGAWRRELRGLRARAANALLLSVLNFLLAILAGAALPVQTGVNSTLRGAVGHPLWATIISFSVGALTVGALLLILRVPAPLALPPLGWKWLGGSLGVIYVCLSLILAPRLGAASLVATVVAGQLVTSVVLDHFGWLGFPQHLVSVPRLLGAALLGAGVWLIQKF